MTLRHDHAYRLDTGEATKSAMLAVSRHAETLALLLADGQDRPRVLALFQHAAYFEQSMSRFVELAEVADVTVGFVGQAWTPRGIRRVELDADEPLAREWTVAVAGRGHGVCLVATETGRIAPASSAERGRTFDYEVTHTASRVRFHVGRVLAALGDRMPSAAQDGWTHAMSTDGIRTERPRDADVAQRDEPEATLERWVREATAVTSEVTQVVHAPALRGLEDADALPALERWAAGAGPRTPKLAAIALRTTGAADGEARTRRVLQAVRSTVPASTLLVRMPDDVLLVLSPGLSPVALEELADRVMAATHRTADDGERIVAATGELDAATLLVGPLLLRLDRAKAGQVVAG